MKLSQFEMVKIVETETHISIVPANVSLVGGCDELVQCPVMVVPEYLARYFEARLAGKSIDDAHAIALQGARIIVKGGKDKAN